MHECGACGLWKPHAEFYRDVRYPEWTPRSLCKTCINKRRKATKRHWIAKVCPGCRQMVPVAGFYLDRSGNAHPPCKACRAAYRPPAVTVAEKRCSNCGLEKPLSEFGIDSRKSTGHASWCLPCVRARRPANIVVPAEKYCPVCRETKPATDFYRDVRRNDGLYTRCKGCHNRRAYPGQQTYREENRPQVREWDSRWRHEHPEHGQIHGQRRRARKKNAPVRDFTKEQWAALKVAYRGCCAYCGQKTRLTIDHVIPLAKGGSHTVSNIVPACKSCNSKKHDRDAPTHQPHLLV